MTFQCGRGPRKDGIVHAKMADLERVFDPLDHNPFDLGIDREPDVSIDFRNPHLARILMHQAPIEIDVLESERCHRSVAHLGHTTIRKVAAGDAEDSVLPHMDQMRPKEVRDVTKPRAVPTYYRGS